jgi:hypothetical protein
MVGRPASRLAVRCVVSRSGSAICENLQPRSPTAITGATSVTARLPPQRSKSMRWRHDNHRRFEVPAANGSRPIAGGPLRGDKVSELFRTGEWIRRRSNCRRETFDRLLLFGWLLPQRDPIGLSCEGVMRRPQVCKHQVCDHCGGRFGMVTHRWWGNKFCKRTCKNAYLRDNHHTLSGWVMFRLFAFAAGKSARRTDGISCNPGHPQRPLRSLPKTSLDASWFRGRHCEA